MAKKTTKKEVRQKATPVTTSDLARLVSCDGSGLTLFATRNRTDKVTRIQVGRYMDDEGGFRVTDATLRSFATLLNKLTKKVD